MIEAIKWAVSSLASWCKREQMGLSGDMIMPGCEGWLSEENARRAVFLLSPKSDSSDNLHASRGIKLLDDVANDPDFLRLCISSGLNPNTSIAGVVIAGYDLLQSAIKQENLESVKVLLSSGAKISDGLMPHDVFSAAGFDVSSHAINAIRADNASILDALACHGAGLFYCDKSASRLSPFAACIKLQKMHCLEYFLEMFPEKLDIIDGSTGMLPIDFAKSHGLSMSHSLIEAKMLRLNRARPRDRAGDPGIGL